MRRLLIGDFLVYAVVSLETAARQVLAGDRDGQVAVGQDPECGVEVQTRLSRDHSREPAWVPGPSILWPQKRRRWIFALVHEDIKLLPEWQDEPEIVYEQLAHLLR